MKYFSVRFFVGTNYAWTITVRALTEAGAIIIASECYDKCNMSLKIHRVEVYQTEDWRDLR